MTGSDYLHAQVLCQAIIYIKLEIQNNDIELLPK